VIASRHLEVDLGGRVRDEGEMAPSVLRHLGDVVELAREDERRGRDSLEGALGLPGCERDGGPDLLAVLVRREQRTAAAHRVAHDGHLHGIDPSHERAPFAHAFRAQDVHPCDEGGRSDVGEVARLVRVQDDDRISVRREARTPP